MRLRSKVAVITGAAGNMGREYARLFAAEGATMALVDVRDECQEVVSEARMPNGEAAALFFHADVCSDADWQRVVFGTVQAYGRIDVLVNNAGVSSSITPDMFDADAWDTIIDTNLKGAFLGVKHVLPAMLQAGGGSIVNVSSIAAIVGLPAGHLAYGCAKAGLGALARTLAARYGDQGIRVNTVYPGAMPSMASKRHTDVSTVSHNTVVGHTPMGRQGHPSEVANAVLFLASEESSFITGADLVVDGGFVAQ